MTKRRKPPTAPAPEILDADTRRTQRRVAKVRDKLSKALEDPDMRKQMVAAIRQMMDSKRS
jgi:hypothetical protein